MKLYKRRIFSQDIDERRELIAGLVGQTVLVNDRAWRREYDMEGTISLSEEGSNRYYYLRVDGTDISVRLEYRNLRELRARVKFAESSDVALLNDSLYPSDSRRR